MSALGHDLRRVRGEGGPDADAEVLAELTHVTVEYVSIRSSPEAVYQLISDPLRIGEWSPECVRCRWIGTERRSQIGARFRGTSRNGWRRWTTTSRVTGLVPNERFAWDVTYFGLSVASWEFRIESGDDGIVLSEAVEDRRGLILRTLSPYLTGSRDRAKRNTTTMTTTLEAIKAAAERGPHEFEKR